MFFNTEWRECCFQRTAQRERRWVEGEWWERGEGERMWLRIGEEGGEGDGYS